MKGFSIDIEEATLGNGNFRKVLYTSKHSQLVLMSLKPEEDIGMEAHEERTSFSVSRKGTESA
jgi:mannose-6-phosphate isomerase-like protein (cupin superfamily)